MPRYSQSETSCIPDLEYSICSIVRLSTFSVSHSHLLSNFSITLCLWPGHASCPKKTQRSILIAAIFNLWISSATIALFSAAPFIIYLLPNPAFASPLLSSGTDRTDAYTLMKYCMCIHRPDYI